MSLNVARFLEDLDADTAKVILEYAKPGNVFGDVTVPDLLSWRFCDVMDMSGKDILTGTIDVIKHYGGLDDGQIQEGSAKEFASLSKFVKLEMEKAGKLMEQLRSEPDADMVNAGIDKLDRFGVVSIYYGISKNPLDWDGISETPFGKMYTKLMLDKVSADIQQNYAKIQHDKQRLK